MNDTSANSIFVALLFVLRCFVPVAILFGVSYLLRKMGLVATDPPEPPDERDESDENDSSTSAVVEDEPPSPEISVTNLNGDDEPIDESEEASQ